MRDFKRNIKVQATPEEVYSAITNPFAIELWTGYPAQMSTEPGSEFEMWDGDICGRNIEFEQDKLVKQEWYFGEEEPSIVTIKIRPRSGVQTEIFVTQTNIPDECYENIAGGWDDDYLASLKQFLEEGDD